MEKQQPSRPRKVKVQPPNLEEASTPVVEEGEENKYARRTSFIGKPTLGRAITVETVGLGNLKVITAHGTDPNV